MKSGRVKIPCRSAAVSSGMPRVKNGQDRIQGVDIHRRDVDTETATQLLSKYADHALGLDEGSRQAEFNRNPLRPLPLHQNPPLPPNFKDRSSPFRIHIDGNTGCSCGRIQAQRVRRTGQLQIRMPVGKFHLSDTPARHRPCDLSRVIRVERKRALGTHEIW